MRMSSDEDASEDASILDFCVHLEMADGTVVAGTHSNLHLVQRPVKSAAKAASEHAE
jgi:hypothetical protein